MRTSIQARAKNNDVVEGHKKSAKKNAYNALSMGGARIFETKACEKNDQGRCHGIYQNLGLNIGHLWGQIQRDKCVRQTTFLVLKGDRGPSE